MGNTKSDMGCLTAVVAGFRAADSFRHPVILGGVTRMDTKAFILGACPIAPVPPSRLAFGA